MADEEKPRSNLSIQTLLISAVSAVAAATVVPLIWERGTVIATAMTPVVVALVSEMLRKPVQRVSTVAPRVAPIVARRSGTGAAVRRFDPDAASTREHAGVGARGRGPERFEPLPPHLRVDGPRLSDDDPYGLRGAHGPWHRLSGKRVRLAVLTGLLAFALAAAAVTASELALFGGSVSGKRGSTTLFSGPTSHSSRKSTKDQATPTPAATQTPQGQATA